MDYLKRSWAVVDLDALEHNYKQIQGLLSPGCRVMAAVKADAYGHGDRYVANHLQALGADFFGVSNLAEAISLRAQGITGDILIFGATPAEHLPLLAQHRLVQTVHSLQYAHALHAAAELSAAPVCIHIKIDTGMSRVGLMAHSDNPDEAAAETEQICAMGGLLPEGIYTHFAVADETDEESRAFTRLQCSRFTALLQMLDARGISFALRHCCNSAATINYPEMHMDLVRPGIALYGLRPGEYEGPPQLRPVMELYSVVSRVKEIAPGATVSYGRRFTADRPTLVATVAIGYADGYSRALSNRARMLVRGEYAPVIGRVCMDQLMLDVTHIPGVEEGDRVTIVGADGGKRLTFDEMAEMCGTIHYEKVSVVGRRVPRVYRRGGEEISAMDYINQDGLLKE